MINLYAYLELDPLASDHAVASKIEARRNAINETIKGKKVTKLAKSALASLDEAARVLLDSESREAYDLELAECADEDMAMSPDKPQAFNYAEYRLNDAPSWREYVDPFEVPTVEIYRQLLRQVVILPNPEYQENILLAALLCPTPLATMLPIVIGYGEPATGKSNIGKFVAKIYGCKLLGSDTTASSLRRDLQPMKFSFNGGILTELPHMLVIDDLDENMLKRNPAILRYLRSGYDRDSSIVKMAKQDSDTESIESDMFGGRVFSTCYPIFEDQSLNEITRRSLFIHCKKSDRSIDLLEISAINWSGFSAIRAQIWEDDPEICIKYVQYKRMLTSYAVRNKLARPDRIALAKDILAAGMALGLWGTAADAYAEYGEFMDAQDLLIKGKSDIVRRVVEGLSIATIEEATSFGIKPRLDPASLKRLTDMYVSQGIFDSNIKSSNVNQIVRSLGWVLSDKDLIWYRA
jgi:hypothetical protein